MQDIWTLPGPHRRISQALDRLYADRVHVLHEPRDPDGLAEAMERQLTADGLRVLPFGPGQAGEFLPALAEALAASAGRSASVLAADPGLEGAVVIVRPDGPCGAGLQGFARALPYQSKDLGPLLLVVAGDAASCIDGVAAEQVRGLFDRPDGAAYAAWLPRSEEPLVGEVIASVAVEVAAWDLRLLDRLTALPKAQAVRPDLHVSAWDGARTAAFDGVSLAWELGVVDRWGGQEVEHPAWLAANKSAKLTKRVWRGQLAALLPWIELHRLHLLERHEGILRSQPDLPCEIELLDWGPLGRLLSAIGSRLARAVEPFRLARNELAHGRPVTWPMIAACLQRSPMLLVMDDAGRRSPERGRQ